MPEFHLSPLGAGGISCDANGAFVGTIPLLNRLRKDDKDAWHPRDCEELSEQIGAHYGLPIDMSAKRGGLKAIAAALNKGDVARAQIVTLLLGISDPPQLSKQTHSRNDMIALIRDLDWSGMLKWDSDLHPRWPAGSADSKGGEFALEGEGGETGMSPHVQPRAADHANPQSSTAAARSARIQLADAAMSDASDDPVAEAAAAAAATQNNAWPSRSSAKPTNGEEENPWQTFGSYLSHEAKIALAQIGQAQTTESYNNLAMAVDQRDEIAHVLKDYADYRAHVLLDSNGHPVEIPAIDIGSPVAGLGGLAIRLAAHESLTRPAVNADWIDPLINLAAAGAGGAGVPFRFASPIADTLGGADIAALSANAEVTSTLDQLSTAATRAAAKVGPGSGRLYGTAVHSAFRLEVEALDNPNLFTEQSYLNGIPVDYGTLGSVRLDVVEGSVAQPTALYDLKTGSAALTRSRIREIQSHLPPTTDSVPIKEVRP